MEGGGGPLSPENNLTNTTNSKFILKNNDHSLFA